MNERKIKGYVEDIEVLINKIDVKQAEIDNDEITFEDRLKDKRNVLSPFLDKKSVDAELDKMKKEHKSKQKKAQKDIDKMEKTAEKKRKKVFKPVDRLETITKMLNKIKENTGKEIKKIEEEIKRLESEIAKADGKEKEKLEKQLLGLNKKLASLIRKLEVIIKQLEKYEAKKVETVRTLKEIIKSATNPDKYIAEADKKEKEKQTKSEAKPEPKTKQKTEENYEPPVIPEVNLDAKRKEKIADEISKNLDESEKKEKQEAKRKKEMAEEINKNVEEKLSKEQQKRAEDAKKKKKEEKEILEEIEKNKPTKEEIEKRMADELKKQQKRNTKKVKVEPSIDTEKGIVLDPEEIAKNKKEREEQKDENLPAVQENKFKIILANLGNNIKNIFSKLRTGTKKMRASMKQAMIEILKEAQEKLEKADSEKQKDEKTIATVVEEPKKEVDRGPQASDFTVVKKGTGVKDTRKNRKRMFKTEIRADEKTIEAVKTVPEKIKSEDIKQKSFEEENELDDAGQVI